MTTKISIILILCCLSSSAICSIEKVAQLQLYVQDVREGPNKSVWEVAQSDITPNSPTVFGTVSVMDNKVTAEPNYNSEEVGRAQAVVSFTDMQVMAITMNFNFYFTNLGEYSGSTLTLLGRHQLVNQANRELPIVGGTGVFRMARGYAIVSNYSGGNITNAVLQYKLYVSYHDLSIM